MKKFFLAITLMLMICAQASAMELKIHRDVDWSISLAPEPFTMKIDGYSQLIGDFSKGVAIFGDKLYFHFNALALRDNVHEENFLESASRFGGSDFKNTVPVYTFEGSTRIYPISSDDGREFFLLSTETGGGGSMKVIGTRDGKWVKFFDTLDAKKNHLGWNVYLQNFYLDGNKIIFVYEHGDTKKISRLIYTWDEAAKWFSVDVRQ